MRFFREGDIIKCPELFGNQLFTVLKPFGNDYCPMLHCNYTNKNNCIANRVNICESMAILHTSRKRIFRKLNKISLLKLVAKKNIEASRELRIRISLKSL